MLKNFKDFESLKESNISTEPYPVEYINGTIKLIDDEEFTELKRYTIQMGSEPSVIFTFIYDKVNKIGYIYCLNLIQPHKFIKILYKKTYKTENEALKDLEKCYTSFVFS